MDPLRKHVVELLSGGEAFDTLDSILEEFAMEDRGVVPEGAERSPWQILEHMRRSIQDILDFTENENGDYAEKEWPADYWPKESSAGPEVWHESLTAYKAALSRIEELVQDESRDLFEPFPWGSGQTLLREVLLVANHAAYHLGELVELKRWIDAAK